MSLLWKFKKLTLYFNYAIIHFVRYISSSGKFYCFYSLKGGANSFSFWIVVYKLNILLSSSMISFSFYFLTEYLLISSIFSSYSNKFEAMSRKFPWMSAFWFTRQGPWMYSVRVSKHCIMVLKWIFFLVFIYTLNRTIICESMS